LYIIHNIYRNELKNIDNALLNGKTLFVAYTFLEILANFWTTNSTNYEKWI